MATPVKFMCTSKQAAKLRAGQNTRAIIQVRRKAGLPPVRYNVLMTELAEETKPYISEDLSDLAGGAMKSNAQAAYDGILEDELDRVGHANMTTREELDSICSKKFGSRYAGSFAPSEMPTLNESVCYAIKNTAESPGRHWIAVIYDPEDPGTPVVYDPLGGSESMKTKPDAEQSNAEDNCGQRCIAFLEMVDSLGLAISQEV